jgi:hypothetical protein
MAGDIGWKSVELQIEALIPGVLILAEAHAAAEPEIEGEARP